MPKYPPMSPRYTREMLQRLSGIELLTLVAAFGGYQVMLRYGVSEEELAKFEIKSEVQ